MSPELTPIQTPQIREPQLRPIDCAIAMLTREMRIALRRLADAINPLFFFAVVAALFPVAISPEKAVLQLIGPGVIWVAALLAALLPLTALFGQDYEDGTLEHYVLSGQSLVALCIAKTVGLWLVAGLPLVLVSAAISQTYAFPVQALPALVLALSLGSYTLCALGAVAAALTVGVQRASALIALLVLPMMVPVIIFGTRAVLLAARSEPIAGPLYLLAATAVLAAVLTPIATAMAVRISLE